MTAQAPPTHPTADDDPARIALVVDPDARRRADLAEWIGHAGYTTTPVATFEAARHRLTSGRVDLLVVALRLGAFNGLHLIIRARAVQPDVRAVLIARGSDADAAAEAARLGAVCVVTPPTRDALLAAVDAEDVQPH